MKTNAIEEFEEARLRYVPGRLEDAAAKGKMSVIQTSLEDPFFIPGTTAIVGLVFEKAVEAVKFQEAYVALKMERERAAEGGVHQHVDGAE